MARRVTLKDIAARAEVHPSTVSAALRDYDTIPKETRERIKAVAKELGYEKDPLLSALSSYRSGEGGHSKRVGTVLGFVRPMITDRFFYTADVQREIYQGIRDQATWLGFRVEQFPLILPGTEKSKQESGSLPPKRLFNVLRSRGIQGIVVAEARDPYPELELDWESFSAVTYNYALQEPRLHRAAVNHFTSMQRALEAVAARGYRRPGLALAWDNDARANYQFSAAFFATCRRLGVDGSVPTLDSFRTMQSADLQPWYAEHRPDVVLGILSEKNVCELSALSDGLCGFVNLNLLDRSGREAGIRPNFKTVGSKCVDMLYGMIVRNEKGIPHRANTLMVESDWVEGESLPERTI